MADFTPVALDVKPPQGMSLGDMLNVANAAQQYQQAQQINPLQVQKAQMEIEQAQKKNPLEIQRAQMEIEQAQKMNPLAVQKATTEANQAKLNFDKSHLDVMGGALTGLESRARLLEKKGDAQTALKELDNTEKYLNGFGIPSMPNGPFAQAREALKNKDMAGYLAQIENMRNMQASAAEKFTANMPAVTEVNGVKYLQDKTTGQLKAMPLPNGAVSPPPADNVQPKNPSVPSEPKFAAQPLFQIESPRSPGQLDTREAARYEIGAKDFEDSTQRAQAASDSSLAASQIRRSLSAAAGSKPGQLVRSAGKALFGNSEYDTLLKNLAEQQVRQAKLMGIESVHAQQDLSTANGSSDITQEALGHIVDRADAMNTATKKYNSALDAFQRKYGKEKAYLNNDNFKKAWADNYDPVAFIVQSTNQRNIPKKEKEAIIDYYTSDMSQEQLDELATKMKKLKRLERGDF